MPKNTIGDRDCLSQDAGMKC